MNEFKLVVEPDESVIQQLQIWQAKFNDYIRNFYQGDYRQAHNTKFGDCLEVSKWIVACALRSPSNFRGVVDEQGRLQAAAKVSVEPQYIQIVYITNAPWNVVEDPALIKKGAATALLEKLVEESKNLGLSGRLKLTSIERAKEFYQSLGFTAIKYGSQTLQLTPEAAQKFLNKQEDLRNLASGVKNTNADLAKDNSITANPSETRTRNSLIQELWEDYSKTSTQQNLLGIAIDVGVRARRDGLTEEETRAIVEVGLAQQSPKSLENNVLTVMRIIERRLSQLGEQLNALPNPNLTQLLEPLEQLSDRELVNTMARVQNYFANKPPQAPSNADQQHVYDEIRRLEQQLKQLQTTQAEMVQQVGQMQQNPLCAWNKKYQAAVAQLQKNVEMVQQSLAQKNQQESQLQQWAQQESAYKTWVNDPKTKQMYDVAEILKLPHIQQRIRQELQQQQQQQHRQKPQQQEPKSRRNRGLSL